MTELVLDCQSPVSRHARPSFLAQLRVWLDRFEQRRQLSQLPEHLLRDIGVNQADADQEAEKPFWKL